MAGATREARRESLNEYLRHQFALASVAPAAGAAARSFLSAADSPLGNAAWRYDAAFGWTDVPVELMQDYVSAQVDALRSAGTGRFGFPWSPKNLNDGLSGPDYIAQTDALLVRLAAAIADSGEAPEAACGTAWCNRDLAGAAANPAWRTFSAWKPSVLAFTTPAQTLSPGAPSSALTVELRTSAGAAYAAGLPVAVTLSSSSPSAELSTSAAGPWSSTLTTQIGTGASATSVYYRDTTGGTATITAASAGKVAATQPVTVVAATPPPPAPAPAPPAPPAPPGGGGGGPSPDLAVQAALTPAAPALGSLVTYVVTVRNLGGMASSTNLVVQLPSQIAFAAGQADRGQGCTGTTILTCELDYLAGDLVATVRIQGTVREPGTLTLTARASSQPADAHPANDTASVVTTVAAAPLPPATADARPSLRAVGRSPVAARRSGTTAVTAIRFWVSEPARIDARLTPLASARALPLLAGTTLAGRRSSAIRSVATAAVAHAGTYGMQVRVRARSLVRGRFYLLRLTATDPAGGRRTLSIRVRYR